MEKLWLVVANCTDARILACDRSGRLADLEVFSCPQAHAPNRDFLTDSPGRSHDRFGPARHSLEPRVNVRRQLREQFARQIAARLERGRTGHEYCQLALIAPADMLGELRAALSEACRKQVVEECPKNIVNQEVETIVEALSFPLQMALKAATR